MFQSASNDDRKLSSPASAFTRMRFAILTMATIFAWPMAIIVGWVCGDTNNVAYVDSIWNGPFPITRSPGFQFIVSTILPFAVGVVLTQNIRTRNIGFAIALPSVLLAGIASFILAVALNVV